jgi:peptidoglycan/LPS O-acetylase OafA/YrhL
VRVAPLLVAFTLLAVVLYPRSELIAYIYEPVYWCRVLAVLGVAGQPTPLPVVWSLDVEARFYVIAPILIYVAFLRPRFEVVLLIAAVALGYASLASGSASTAVNLAQFSAFFLCGVLHARGRLLWAAKSALPFAIPLVLIILLGISAFPKTRLLLTNYTAGWPAEMIEDQNLLMFTLGLLLVPLALASVHWKAWRFDRAIGDMAYPLYLCHLIPLAFYQRYEFGDAAGKAAGLILAWAAVVVLTVLGYLLIDRPSENLRKRFVASRKKRAVSSCQPHIAPELNPD